MNMCARQLALLPQPQNIVYEGGRCQLPRWGVIGIPDHRFYPVAKQLRRLIRKCSVNIHAPPLTEIISIRLTKQQRPGGYKLWINSRGIILESDSLAAAFWGSQTLIQIAEQCPDGFLPCLTIKDWPDFQDRGVYYDVSRGRVPKLERLMELADNLAKYKINQFQLYIEHTFDFRGHPGIGKGVSPLKAEDILKLDAYCQERHIELVPSLASFGHLSTVLKHPQYHHLTEDWGKGKYVTPDQKKCEMLEDWIKRYKQKAFTLSPANPEIYRFLDSLFAEFLPLFSSKRFNVCCDETVDLGYGQSYKLCQKIGRGRLYLSHILKLNALSQKYGKQIMFWGDIIRHYPELIREIPKEVTVLDWGYQYNHNFERTRDFKRAGVEFYVCPSVSGYCALFPRLPQAMANIAGFAAAGHKYGARGLLNTDWGDGGHYNFMEYSWPGFLFGAEQSWNVKSDAKDFTERFSRLFLNIGERRFSEALDELGRISHLKVTSFYQSVWRHIFYSGARQPVWNPAPQTACLADRKGIHEGCVVLNANFGRDTFVRLNAIRKVFSGQVGIKGKDPLKILPYWIFAVENLRHAARKLWLYAPDGERGAAGRKALQKEHNTLRSRFIELWMARNRRSEIGITLKQYQKARQAELTFKES